MNDKPYKQFKQYRLPDYDYSSSGGYFITLCVKNREEILSNMIENVLKLTELGVIIDKNLSEIPVQFPDIAVDIAVIMPDHIHVIFLFGASLKNGEYEISFQDNFQTKHIGKSGIPNNPMEINRLTIGGLMRWFKAKCTYDIRNETAYNNFSWQTRFHDRVIRNQEELDIYRNYIIQNPDDLHS